MKNHKIQRLQNLIAVMCKEFPRVLEKSQHFLSCDFSDKTKYRNCATTSHTLFCCIASTLLLVTIRSVSKCNEVKVPINDKKLLRYSLQVVINQVTSLRQKLPENLQSNVTRYFYFVTEQVCIWKGLQQMNNFECYSRSSELPLFDRPHITSY